MSMKFRKHFDYDVELASEEAAIVTVGDSLTVQEMADDADLNVLMKRYGVTGKLPEEPRVPMYGDFSMVTDYRSAIHAVMAADEAFMQYPADLRARFENDPQKMLEFVENPANVQELVRLGLAVARPAEMSEEGRPVPQAPVVTSATAPPSPPSGPAVVPAPPVTPKA